MRRTCSLIRLPRDLRIHLFAWTFKLFSSFWIRIWELFAYSIKQLLLMITAKVLPRDVVHNKINYSDQKIADRFTIDSQVRRSFLWQRWDISNMSFFEWKFPKPFFASSALNLWRTTWASFNFPSSIFTCKIWCSITKRILWLKRKYSSILLIHLNIRDLSRSFCLHVSPSPQMFERV